jgi:hypothetical protein
MIPLFRGGVRVEGKRTNVVKKANLKEARPVRFSKSKKCNLQFPNSLNCKLQSDFCSKKSKNGISFAMFSGLGENFIKLKLSGTFFAGLERFYKKFERLIRFLNRHLARRSM